MVSEMEWVHRGSLLEAWPDVALQRKMLGVSYHGRPCRDHESQYNVLLFLK